MKKLWNWYYGGASIRKKLVISYLVLVLIPIFVLGIESYTPDQIHHGKQYRFHCL